MSTATLPLYRGRADRDPVLVGVVLLDDADFEWAQSYHWTLNTYGYAARRFPRPSRISILIHREILGLTPSDSLVTDHINRDKLDCRRANLRIVTRSQNNQNRGAYRNGQSRFRGVCWDRDRECWRATAQADGKWKQIGRFDTEEAAALAASAWRREHMLFSTECPVAA